MLCQDLKWKLQEVLLTVPACSQSFNNCTAQHALPTHPGCAGMTDSCAHAWDDVTPHRSIKRLKTQQLLHRWKLKMSILKGLVPL